MNNQIRLLFLILITTGWAFGPAFSNDGSWSQRYLVRATREEPEFTTYKDEKRPSRCTREALAADKSIPKLNYRCGEDSDDVLKDSPRRRAALRAYLTRLESGASASWWAASVDDLNACAITHSARALTDNERSEFESSKEVSGDQSTRLLVLPDPCVKYSFITRNAFVLQRAGGQVYATQVVDAFYTRLGPGVEGELAHQNGETLVIVDTASEPTPATEFGDAIRGIGQTSLSVYAIDAGTHRAVPRNLFMDKGKLTNVLSFEGYLLDDEELEKQWHPPELVRNGVLSPRFKVYSLADSGDTADPRPKFVAETYVWNGQYYAVQAKRPRSPVRR
jgi:hypothetical protein